MSSRNKTIAAIVGLPMMIVAAAWVSLAPADAEALPNCSQDRCPPVCFIMNHPACG
ncbi:MAG: hypothetical protein ACRBN8_34110 [Nannocystales bacterium]